MHINKDEALSKLNASGKLFVELFSHGSLNVEIYRPEEKDMQTPHDRDEVYVIIAGETDFLNGGIPIHAKAGDVLFVSAGKEHRFENFTHDFCTWVFFYGPAGGEG